MGRLSEEQKKDLKVKVVLGVIGLAILGPVLLAGPLLPTVVDRYRKDPTDPNAPKVFYYAGKIMLNTFRRDEGIALLEEGYILFGDDHAVDAGGVEFVGPIEEDPTFKLGWYYLPWVVERQPDGVRPPPAQVADRELMGRLLAAVASHYEDESNYSRARHIFACMFHLWPEGSWTQQDAAKGRLRAIQRSYGS